MAAPGMVELIAYALLANVFSGTCADNFVAWHCLDRYRHSVIGVDRRVDAYRDLLPECTDNEPRRWWSYRRPAGA